MTTVTCSVWTVRAATIYALITHYTTQLTLSKLQARVNRASRSRAGGLPVSPAAVRSCARTHMWGIINAGSLVFTHILVPLDGSADSTVAVTQACAIAALSDARVTLLRVYSGGTPTPETLEYLHKAAL